MLPAASHLFNFPAKRGLLADRSRSIGSFHLRPDRYFAGLTLSDLTSTSSSIAPTRIEDLDDKSYLPFSVKISLSSVQMSIWVVVIRQWMAYQVLAVNGVTLAVAMDPLSNFPFTPS